MDTMKLFEKTVKEQEIYSGRIIRVHLDDVVLENGHADPAGVADDFPLGHHAVVQLHVVHMDAAEVPVTKRGVFQCFFVHSKCAPFLWAAHSPAGVSRSFIARPVMSLG